MNTTIIKHINENEELMVDLVTEFFKGKYTKEEVNNYMYGMVEGSPRNGVVKLAEEFNNLENRDVDSIKNWYAETDFYIFDLLPWNGCGMFEEKIKNLSEVIKHYKFNSVIDFGGGLGITSIFLAQELGCTVYYVDIENSVTSQFAKFFMEKMGVTSVTMMTDREFFSSDVNADVIVSLDCFEHIPNMEETFDKLINHSNVIIHDSTFHSDQWSPQHVYTPNTLEFINMCALRNYIPRESSNVLWRSYVQISNQGNLELKFI